MALPKWLDPLYSPDEMRAADGYAMERCGISELELAEKAGAGLAASVEAIAVPGPVRIVVGPGNNGGDGLVAARLLRYAGHEVDVLAPLSLEGLEGVPRTNLDRLPGQAPRTFEAGLLEDSGAVVDAMLGTGFTGVVGEPLDAVIRAISAQDAPVVAADVPSGVNAETGEAEGVAVRAAVTSTNHAPKIGLFVGPGAGHTGHVRVADIGIPPGDPGAGLAGLTTRRVLDLLSPRSRYGPRPAETLVAGGSRGSTGTAYLAALAAARGGAGRVGVAVPDSAVTVVDPLLPEAAVHGLPEDGEGRHVEEGAAAVTRLAARGETRTTVLGPGVGDGSGEASFTREVRRSVAGSLVVSSGALPASGEELDELARRPGPTVLVAEPGGLARLLDDGQPGGSEKRPLEAARRAADRGGAVVVLAGEDPVVAAPGGPCTVTPGVAGASDTDGVLEALAGLIGALLSRGLDPLPAAAAGVFAHVGAVRLASDRAGGAEYTTASDIVRAPPESLSAPGS